MSSLAMLAGAGAARAAAPAEPSAVQGATPRPTGGRGPDSEAAPDVAVASGERSFYGGAILAFGGAGALATAGALALPSQPFDTTASDVAFLLGAPTYLLAGPITHWSRGYFEKGLISLGGNILFALLGGVLGERIACAGSNAAGDCDTKGRSRGAAVGVLLAPVADALVLGWEDNPSAARVTVGSPSELPARPRLAWGFGLGSDRREPLVLHFSGTF